jgi:amidase
MHMKYTLSVLALLLATSQAPAPRPATAPGKASPRLGSGQAFDVFEASIADMQTAMKAGRTTSHAIVQQYLTRIAMYEDKLHAAITVNPKALDEADALDRERAAGKIRGPLHGIPIALKDNVHTTNMPTTGGALAFVELVPPYEATLTKNLRAAGAIIIAKTGMTELANYIGNGMPTNYNAVHGYGFNPYDPRRDPRAPGATADGRPVLQTGGSSSGIGTAANFWAGNVGTETSGSILSPSNQNMLAAVKPTVGRISRHGVIPITADQDTPGPMAKYVMDVALMLGALEGASPDPNDAATKACTPPPGNDYAKLLKADGLKGARIGIPRKNYYEPFDPPVVRPEGAPGAGGGRGGGRGGLNPAQTKVMEEAIAALKGAGAMVIDVDIPSMLEKDPKENLLTAGQSSVLSYGMKRDFNTWLASLGPAAPVKSLAELIEWNTAHEKMGSIKYGQALLIASDKLDLEKDRAKYQEDRARDIRVYGTNGIDAAVKANNLDALLFPGPASAGIASKPGYPTVLVPFGMIPNAPGQGGRGGGGGAAAATAPAGRGATPPAETVTTTTTPPAPGAAPATAAAATAAAATPPAAPVPFPAGFEPKPQPYGVGFTGPACSEPKLLQLAYAFEQATKKRTPPPGLR